jgi:hypothetical protein
MSYGVSGAERENAEVMSQTALPLPILKQLRSQCRRVLDLVGSWTYLSFSYRVHTL